MIKSIDRCTHFNSMDLLDRSLGPVLAHLVPFVHVPEVLRLVNTCKALHARKREALAGVRTLYGIPGVALLGYCNNVVSVKVHEPSLSRWFPYVTTLRNLRHLQFTFKHMLTGEEVDRVFQLHQLQVLRCCVSDDVTDDQLMRLADMRELCVLRVSFRRMPTHVMAHIAARCSALEDVFFVVTKPRYTSHDLEAISKQFTHGTLRRLTIRGPDYHVSADQAVSLLALNNPMIKWIDMLGCQLNDNTLDYVVARCTNLRVLDVDLTGRVAHVLSRYPDHGLTQVTVQLQEPLGDLLESSHITSASIRVTDPAFVTLRTPVPVKRLVLNNLAVELRSIMRYLPEMERLRCHDMTFIDEDAKELVRCCPRLQELKMLTSSLTDDGCSVLGDHVTNLSIHSSHITGNITGNCVVSLHLSNIHGVLHSIEGIDRRCPKLDRMFVISRDPATDAQVLWPSNLGLIMVRHFTRLPPFAYRRTHEFNWEDRESWKRTYNR